MLFRSCEISFSSLCSSSRSISPAFSDAAAGICSSPPPKDRVLRNSSSITAEPAMIIIFFALSPLRKSAIFFSPSSPLFEASCGQTRKRVCQPSLYTLSYFYHSLNILVKLFGEQLCRRCCRATLFLAQNKLYLCYIYAVQT